jgi:hypothetical protein
VHFRNQHRWRAVTFSRIVERLKFWKKGEEQPGLKAIYRDLIAFLQQNASTIEKEDITTVEILSPLLAAASEKSWDILEARLAAIFPAWTIRRDKDSGLGFIKSACAQLTQMKNPIWNDLYLKNFAIPSHGFIVTRDLSA